LTPPVFAGSPLATARNLPSREKEPPGRVVRDGRDRRRRGGEARGGDGDEQEEGSAHEESERRTGQRGIMPDDPGAANTDVA
jgi:hypothetical protein